MVRDDPLTGKCFKAVPVYTRLVLAEHLVLEGGCVLLVCCPVGCVCVCVGMNEMKVGYGVGVTVC